MTHKIIIPFGAGQKRAFYKKVRQIFGSSLVGLWPLNEQSGIVAVDYSGRGANGAYSSPTLSNAVGVSGKNVVSFPGVGSALNLWSEPAKANINFSEGFFGGWYKADTINRWTDGATDYLFAIKADANNQIYLRKHPSAWLTAGMINGGTSVVVDGVWQPTKRAPFEFLGVSWSRTNGLRLIWNGGIVGTPAAISGTWAGALTSFWLGGQAASSNNFPGWYDTWFLTNVEPTAAQLKSIMVAPKARVKRLVILGDSISVDSSGTWAELYTHITNNGYVWYADHAVASMGIITGATNMAAQVTASASDDADNIYIALGTNDSDTSDTLRSTYETNINAAKASNPRAKIYGIGIFPRADMTGVSTKNGRIQTGCENTGSTFVDTTNINYGGVTFDQAIHTSDGVHPNATGAALIANWLYANYG